MRASDDMNDGEEPGVDEVTSALSDEHHGADDDASAPGKRREVAAASDKLRDRSDPENASSETS